MAKRTPPDGSGESPPDLATEMAALRREVEVLNQHRFIKLQNSVPRLLAFQFARGLALGLGTVVGASVLVSLVAYFLSQIEFLPIIGDWALNLAEQIEAQVRANQSAATGPDATAGPDGSIEPEAAPD